MDADVKLFSIYGATEFGPISYFFRNEGEKKLWDWVRFGPNTKIRWAPQDNDTYECQLLVRLSTSLHTPYGIEHFADDSETSIVSRESPGHQGLFYVRYIPQASDNRGSVEDVTLFCIFMCFLTYLLQCRKGR